MAAGLHHPAPSALRGAGRRQPARPLHGPSAAGAGRRRHHRPHLASQRHSARQPGGRFPGGARRRPTRPECVRVASRQLGSDAARRLPQPQPGQSVRARGAGGAHAARASGQTLPLWEAAALPRRRAAGGARRGRALRHRIVARLGRQGPAPAGHPRRAGAELRAHPPQQPDRHGHSATAPAAAVGPAVSSSRPATASTSTRRPARCGRAPRCRCACCAPMADSSPSRRSRPWKRSWRPRCWPQAA